MTDPALASPAQLDLFGAPAPSPEPGVTHRPVAPSHLVPSAEVPWLLRHPKANRESVLSGWPVAYHFQRSRRRTLGLSIGPAGVSVRAPHSAPWAEVERFLQSKTNWVLAKLRELHGRRAQTPAEPVWAEGGRIAYLGRELTLTLDPEHRFQGAGAAVDGDRLLVALPSRASADALRHAVHAWLMREAECLFRRRLDHYAPQLGVRYTRLGLSSAGTRWGSARADGAIRLNWRLVHLPPSLVDYVVVHELSHLREMNHSPAFWRVVESVLPDQAERRRELRRHRLPTS